MFEINLVPDAKAELVEAQKSRNLVVFVCTVVSVFSVAVVLLSFLFKTTQDVTMARQDARLELLSAKMKEYNGIDEILTIRNQLNTIEGLRNDKKVLSRVFMILQSLLPTGGDQITISTMDVDLEDYIVSLEGQAVAGSNTDGINSRVLEAFQKQVGMMRYDYGRYVTAKGNEIPVWCIEESDANGLPYVEGSGVLFAIWRRGTKGCNPDVQNSSEGTSYTEDTTVVSIDDEEMEQEEVEEAIDQQQGDKIKIYRTPLFEEWDDGKTIGSDGKISGIPHFESECNQYTKGSDGKWTTVNECMMTDGAFELTDSPTNGRQDTGNLVLRFEGQISFKPEVFDYNNKHLITIAPSGKTNVTDSFVQVEQIFDEKALDCDKDDASCKKGE